MRESRFDFTPFAITIKESALGKAPVCRISVACSREVADCDQLNTPRLTPRLTPSSHPSHMAAAKKTQRGVWFVCARLILKVHYVITGHLSKSCSEHTGGSVSPG